MTMGISGFKHKKDLIAHVGKSIEGRVVETSMFGAEFRRTGTNVFVGPSTMDRKWFAEVECKDGIVVSVR